MQRQENGHRQGNEGKTGIGIDAVVAALAALGQRPATHPTVGMVTRRIARAIRRLLGARSTHVLLYEPGVEDPTVSAWEGPTGEGPLSPSSALALSAEALRTGRPTFIADPSAASPGVAARSAEVLPLRFAGSPIGFVVALDPQSGQGAPSEDDQRLFEAVVGHLASAIHGERLIEECETERARLGALMDSIPLPTLVVRGEDPQTAVLALANAAFVQILGHPPEPDIPLGQIPVLYEFYRPDRTTRLTAEEMPLARAMVRGEVVRQEEIHLRDAAGQWRIFLANAAPTWVDSRANGAVAVLQDVTEAKEHEGALRESEERYRSLVEATSDWIWEVDARGVYTYASPKVRDLLGYEPEEVIGRTPFDLMPPEEAERVRALFQEIAAACRPFSGLENRNVHRDGQVVVLETNGVPITDAEGRLRGYRGIDRDITRRKRAEEALRFLADASKELAGTLEHREILQRLARLAVPVLGDWCILYGIDSGGRVTREAVVQANPAKADLARRLMACPAPLLERARPEVEALQTGQPQILTRIPERLLQALATGGEEHLEILREIAPTSSMTVPFHVRGRLLGVAHFLFTDPGRTYDEGHAALAREVAQRAAVAMDTARLYEELREASAAKDRFLAVLSHELRNPLAPILAGVEVLRRAAPDNERVRRTVEIIERNVKLQARLVGDLLDLSRIARGMVRLQQVLVSLGSVVQSAAQTMRPDAEEAGVRLSADCERGLWVHGDPDRLQQVVMNLLSNAIKFTPAGGEVRIQCFGGQAAGSEGEPVDVARLVVEDTGMGIPNEMLPRLFRMFEQGEVAAGRKPGLGIGLALVRALAERHSGRVWAESEGPGKGSRFTVELPLERAPAAAGREPEKGGEPSPAHLLLVEDNPDTLAMLADSLELAGYQVDAAASGEDALDKLRSDHPDVILSDIGLPGMDGYEFLRRAHEVPGAEAVPAFALTGFGQPEDVDRARSAGYVGHFTKPVDVSALAQRVREWLQPAPGEVEGDGRPPAGRN